MTAKEHSTTSQRRQIRNEALRHIGLSPDSDATRSQRAFLRRKIPELRLAKTLGERKAEAYSAGRPAERGLNFSILNSTAVSQTELVHLADLLTNSRFGHAFRENAPPYLRAEVAFISNNGHAGREFTIRSLHNAESFSQNTQRQQKVFGGRPANDNKQTESIRANFAEQRRRIELIEMNGTDLLALVKGLLDSRDNFLLRAAAPDHTDHLQDLRMRYFYPLSRGEKELFADAIIKLERHKPEDSPGSTPSAGITEVLRTDELYLKGLNDTRLLDHLKKLLKDPNFKSTANAKELSRLSTLSAWFWAPLAADERSEIINNIVSSQQKKQSNPTWPSIM